MCNKFNHLQFIMDLSYSTRIGKKLKIVRNVPKFFGYLLKRTKGGRSEKLYFEPRNRFIYDIKNLILLDLL